MTFNPFSKSSQPLGSVNITSHNQSGGITAHTVNVGLPPRRIDAAFVAQLRQYIPGPAEVDVTAVMGDGEAFDFASQIFEHLKSRPEITVTGVDQTIVTPPVKGTAVQQQPNGKFVVHVGRHQMP